MKDKLFRLVLPSLLLLLAQTASGQQLPAARKTGSAATEPIGNADKPQSSCDSSTARQGAAENDIKTNESLAICSLQANRFDTALSYLDPVLQNLNNSHDAAYPYYLRAKAYSGENDIRKAAADLEKAVSLEPEFAAAWSDLGLARKALLDRAGAFEAFRRAVELDPNDSVAQYRLGSEYLRRGESHLAVAHLNAARRLDPQDQSTLNSLQLALRRDGQTARADEVTKDLNEILRRQDILYQKALQAVSINNEGARLEKDGDLRGAAAKYRAALEVDPGQLRIRVNLAIALLRLGSWGEGLSELRAAIHSDPANGLLRRAWFDATSQAPPGTLVDGIPLKSLQSP